MHCHDKHCLRRRLTSITFIFLLISNTLIVSLLLYDLISTLSGIIVDMGDYEVEVHLVDGLEQKLLAIGIVITLLSTFIGTYITWMLLGRFLKPLDELSRHMKRTDRNRLLERTELESTTTEIDEIITSYNSMIDRLSSAFETQRNFSEYIAHELRTPLAVTKAKIDVWKKEGSGDAEELVDSIARQVKMLSDMVGGILDLTNVERSELRDEVPLGMLAEEVILDLDDMAAQKDVDLALEDGIDIEDPRYTVKGSHELLHRAIYNLVQNGIKYNFEGGSVVIGMRCDRNHVHLTVLDTGVGIPEDELQDIFTPFYRCEKSVAGGKPGYGIGLALTEKIIEHHGAKLNVKQRSEGGSVFTISFDREMDGNENIGSRG